jgi:3',5'-cyclic AMP phosphodiesterase CpdA/tetratricopeptide (TPR) repeat protein
MPAPARQRIRLLHLSDLHLGKETGAARWRMRRVLGQAWAANLKTIAADGPVDLVCFTGDLAQRGAPAEYDEATRFVDELLSALRVPRDRFFCVPGNHDVDRSVNTAAWKDLRNGAWEISSAALAAYLLPGGRVPRGFDPAWPDQVLARQAAYQHWLTTQGFRHLLPANGPHGRLGWRTTLTLGAGDLPLHLIGLDSAWLAGDDDDSGKLRLTEEQIGRLLHTDDGQPLPGPKIALLHHPFSDLADGRDAQRRLAEFGVQLVLHGHLHDAELARWETPSQGLHTAAAGCLYEHDRFPNSLQLLELDLAGPDLRPARLWARCWSARGHWHNDDGLYPDSNAGRLDLLPAPPPPPLDLTLTPSTFIGRNTELAALCAALLPATEGVTVRPTLLCCAIDGMPGVGKTRLAEQFVRQHWLPRVGLAADDNPADAVLRLVLAPADDGSGEAPDADALARDLADRLRLSTEPVSLMARLAEALRHGPGGHPRLLLVENVDGPAQAAAVGRLVNRLPGCPVLVTARFQQLGRANGWQRVPVPPMPLGEARALLLAETDATTGHRLTAREADDLALRLGRLPLALHIAASHLSLGRTPTAFVRLLQDTGLTLPPADPADVRLSTDQARAILHSSFQLSWAEWTRLHPSGQPWHAAPARLAHGPTTSVGLSLATALTGLPDADEVCNMVTDARRLSLLEWPEGRLQLHPLLAEFLRALPLADAAEVRHRMGAWFLERLPETGDDRQGQAWGEVWSEFDALAFWLQHLPMEAAVVAERAGSQFAIQQGPYGAWQAFCQRLLEISTQDDVRSNVLFTLAAVATRAGDPNAALHAAHTKLDLERALGREREAAIAAGLLADVLEDRGDLDEALHIRRQQELPVYERLGDQRERAIAVGKIADVLQARGQLDEALRIRREEELPVHERLGHQRERAITMGKIADVLQARGNRDEALRIRREEELPVYEMLGDQHSRAVTMGQIADVLQVSGNLDEALRIRREVQLPVYEKLGDQRSRAVTMGKIADVLQARGELDEALRIRREDELPVYEKLGDQRELLIGRTKLALILMRRAPGANQAEADQLLRLAQAAAQRLRLPEAGLIEEIYASAFGRPITEGLPAKRTV